MIKWREEGLLLCVRTHGESSVIIDVLTHSHGRHTGLVRSGRSKKLAPVLQYGARLDVNWSARLAEHMGAFTVELIEGRAALFSDPLALDGVGAICGLLMQLLPERQSQPGLYERTLTLLNMIGHTPAWPLAYLKWEMDLLDILGGGLDLSRCAVTGVTDNLVYISPKTGRAVSARGAGEWTARLLPLYDVMRAQPGGDCMGDIANALSVTGHFLERLAEGRLSAARGRLCTRLSKVNHNTPYAAQG